LFFKSLPFFIFAFLLVLGLGSPSLADEGLYIITRDEHNNIIMNRDNSLRLFVPQGNFILGLPQVTIQECIAYIKAVNPNPKLQCSLEDLIKFYYKEAIAEGVRADLAVCQAIKETGFFKYGGDVVPEQNNYCGLGTTGGGVKGAYFVSPQLGVRAHIQHLLAYATNRPPLHPIVDPRYELLKTFSNKFAQCLTWESLNGNWAVPGVGYGESIVKILDAIKAYNGR